MNQKINTLAIAGALTCLLSSAHAASISWGSAATISGVSDVSTTGTLNYALNLGGNTQTLNGVTFNAAPVVSGGTGTTIGDFYSKMGDAGGGGVYDPNGTPTGGAGTGPWDAINGASSAYGNFISSGWFVGAQANGGTASGGTNVVTFNNLTVGHTYQVQLWTYDGRNGRAGYNMVLDGTATVLLNDKPYVAGSPAANAADGMGQYIIGSFIADATSQSFTGAGFLGTGAGSAGRVQINGIQLRTTAVPEPTVALLGGLGLLGLLRRRRSA